MAAVFIIISWCWWETLAAAGAVGGDINDGNVGGGSVILDLREGGVLEYVLVGASDVVRASRYSSSCPTNRG